MKVPVVVDKDPLAPGQTLHRRRDGLASPRGGDAPQDARGRSTPSGLLMGVHPPHGRDRCAP
jgi:hypothetical protein